MNQPIKQLPRGVTVRLGDVVTGSYWATNDVTGPVVGWSPGSTHIEFADHLLHLPDETVQVTRR